MAPGLWLPRYRCELGSDVSPERPAYPPLTPTLSSFIAFSSAFFFSSSSCLTSAVVAGVWRVSFNEGVAFPFFRVSGKMRSLGRANSSLRFTAPVNWLPSRPVLLQSCRCLQTTCLLLPPRTAIERCLFHSLPKSEACLKKFGKLISWGMLEICEKCDFQTLGCFSYVVFRLRFISIRRRQYSSFQSSWCKPSQCLFSESPQPTDLTSSVISQWGREWKIFFLVFRKTSMLVER